jgi:mono/diheme cytochrome c family protein
MRRAPPALLPLTLAVLAACGGKDDRVEEILALDGDADAGAEVFGSSCAGCHGADGGGGSGPNLQGEDEAEDVAEMVLTGDGSMPAFDGELSDQEIADVVAYVTEAL